MEILILYLIGWFIFSIFVINGKKEIKQMGPWDSIKAIWSILIISLLFWVFIFLYAAIEYIGTIGKEKLS